jgi:hypothetical protein
MPASFCELVQDFQIAKSERFSPTRIGKDL